MAKNSERYEKELERQRKLAAKIRAQKLARDPDGFRAKERERMRKYREAVKKRDQERRLKKPSKLKEIF